MTASEKLIILLLTDIMKSLNVESDFDPELIARLTYSGDDWALPYAYLCLDDGDDGEAIRETEVKETADILTMWVYLEVAINRLEADGIQGVQGLRYKHFPGFDANDAPHHSIASTFIQDLKRFASLANHPLNSHGTPSIGYHRMALEKFENHRDDFHDDDVAIELLQHILN